MSLAKSIFDGIGSGAGAAWPAFGISSALIGAAIGGPISIALGSVAVLTFLGVGISITYLSYQEKQEAQSSLTAKIKQNENELQTIIRDYLSTHLKTDIKQELRLLATHHKNSTLYLMLHLIHDNYTELNKHLKTNTLTPQIINQLITNRMAAKPTPLPITLIPAFFGFIGTLGATAGCSAGVSGLLTGLGLFSSFAAFPLLGMTILTCALVFGIVVGVEAAFEAQDTYQARQHNKLVKTMHQQLSHVHLATNMINGIHSALSTLPSADKKAISSKVEQHIAPLLHLRAKASSVSFTFFKWGEDGNVGPGAQPTSGIAP